MHIVASAIEHATPSRPVSPPSARLGDVKPLLPFHPTVRRWFEDSIGTPSAPQAEGWPRIRAGRHTLIAAPTGTGKTLAAFLSALDSLLRQGDALADETHVLYVSPLKALGNDVQKNLTRPLGEMRALDPSLPEVRVLVRTGDTPASERLDGILTPEARVPAQQRRLVEVSGSR